MRRRSVPISSEDSIVSDLNLGECRYELVQYSALRAMSGEGRVIVPAAVLRAVGVGLCIGRNE